MPRLNPYLVLIVGVISVSTSAILVKLADAPSGVTAFYRLFFTILIMLPIFSFKYIEEIRHIKKRDWLFSIISGLFLALHFILWFESLNYTSVASSTVLVTLQPLFAFIGSYLFFNEKITAEQLLCGIVAIVGSFIISWGDFQISSSALYGDLLALVACALITAYMLLGQSLRRRLSLITYTFIVYCISTLILLIYVLIMDEALFHYSQSSWIYFIILAIVPTLLGHSLFNWTLKWLSATTVSMAILFEPVGATLLAIIIIGEMVTLTQIIGGIIIFISVSLYLKGNLVSNE